MLEMLKNAFYNSQNITQDLGRILAIIYDGDIDKNNMMYDFFYMFAKTKIPNMPVRTGYVYGYLKVKEYMRKNKRYCERRLEKNSNIV